MDEDVSRSSGQKRGVHTVEAAGRGRNVTYAVEPAVVQICRARERMQVSKRRSKFR